MTLAVSKFTTAREIFVTIQLRHLTITYDAAKKQRLLLSDDLQQQGHQFKLPPAYTDVVQAADSEAHVQLSIEDRENTRRIQRLFICPGVSQEAS